MIEQPRHRQLLLEMREVDEGVLADFLGCGYSVSSVRGDLCSRRHGRPLEARGLVPY